MHIIDPGHYYTLTRYSPEKGFVPSALESLEFVKKIGDRFPGNKGLQHAGTSCQEVLRVLIDRCKYINNQIPCEETTLIIQHLREALLLFEIRAARIKDHHMIHDGSPIEDKIACDVCGHIYPHSHT